MRHTKPPPTTDAMSSWRGPLPSSDYRHDVPVFDRGSFEPVNDDLKAGLNTGAGGGLPPMRRSDVDRRPVRRVVTGGLLGDPRPGRCNRVAGKAPDCEESLVKERSDEAYRLLGEEPPANNYALKDLDQVKARLERLRPRRYVPPFKDAAE